MKEIKEAEIVGETITDIPTIIEPQAKVTTVGEITSNIKEVKEQALALKEHYEKLVITEDNLNEAKNEKANVNKVKGTISDYRKNIVKEYKKPIEEFEMLAKETENILAETYELINAQCSKYDEEKKKEKEDVIRTYFNELKDTKQIGFLNYDKFCNITGFKVNLSDSETKLRKKIDEFVENIEKDLSTIETENNCDEVLVEYMKTYDLANSIKIVNERSSAPAEIEKNKLQEETKEVEQPKVEILSKPTVVTKEQKVAIKFIATGTREQLKELINFMNEKGIDYEQSK